MEATTGELEAMRQHRDNAENDSREAWCVGGQITMVRPGVIRRRPGRFFTRNWIPEREVKP